MLIWPVIVHSEVKIQQHIYKMGVHYFCSLSAHWLERSQVCCVRGNPHQTFMKRQTDIINLSSPSVVNMLGCGGRLHSDHS